MIVALYGRSQTGKTTLAEALQAKLEVPLRSCGEIVKQTARHLGVSVDRLSDDEHRRIDAETVSWVTGDANCIVEGRFLDCVLGSTQADLRLIQLLASDPIRSQRGTNASGKEVSVADIREVDRSDQTFRERLYGSITPLRPALTIDTSDKSFEKCLQELTGFLQKPTQPPV